MRSISFHVPHRHARNNVEQIVPQHLSNLRAEAMVSPKSICGHALHFWLRIRLLMIAGIQDGFTDGPIGSLPQQ